MTLAYLGDSGIVLLAGDEPAQYDDQGVRWQWNGDEPWSPSPAPRTVTGENATDHGSWDATEFYGPRRYALEGLAHAPDHQSLHAAKSRFAAACGIRPFDLRVLEPGFDRVGRFRRDGDLSWTELTNSPNSHIARFSVPLWAGDPRAYSTTVQTASTGLPSSTGGLTLPFTVPLTIPGTVTSGELNLTNQGTVEAFPTFRIDGPIVNPGVVHMGTGQSWRLNLTLVAGDWVTVDTSTHQVLALGDINGSRRSTWSGDWFGLAPGANTLRFIGEPAGAGAQLTASFRSAWI